jgi:hypothetical protein
MSLYTINVTEAAARTLAIRQKVEGATDRRPFFELGGAAQQLPVIRLDVSLPLYRMANFRTQTRQRDHIRQNQCDATYFSHGQEDVSAQRAQHAILVKLSRTGSGETILPIHDVLSQEASQTQPLVITREGVLLNGNRRLAAMRELLAEDGSRFSAFASVECLVLPPGITDLELEKAEVRLQMQPETKLPYDWTDEALAIRKLRDDGMTDTAISSLMRRNGPAEVQALVSRLDEAEIFLADYLRRPGEHTVAQPHEQLFGDLQKALKKRTTTEAKELSRAICHVMAKHSREVGGRVYGYKEAFGAQADEVAARLVLVRGAVPPAAEAPAETTEDHLFDDVARAPSSAAAMATQLIRATTDSLGLATDIAEIVRSLQEEKQEKDIGGRALKAAKSVNTSAHEVLTYLPQADAGTLAAIRSQLDNATAQIELVRQRIDG